MEMKYVVPDMAQSFGTLEFAGESEPVFERDKNNRRVLARRSYNLYSDVQKAVSYTHLILPVSHMIHGVYDIDGVSLSMPAIVLLHSTSSTNAQILDELLDKWEAMGYSFCLLYTSYFDLRFNCNCENMEQLPVY